MTDTKIDLRAARRQPLPAVPLPTRMMPPVGPTPARQRRWAAEVNWATQDLAVWRETRKTAAE